MQEMGPAVYRSIPRRLKRLTVYRCHSKVSSFSPVLSRPWVLVRSGAWTLHLTHGSSAPNNLSRRWLNDHSGLMKMKTDVIWGPVSTWRINSETASKPQNRIMDHEINNDTRFSVSSSMSSYSASSILLVLPSAPFCYTLVGQITFSQELRWGQNKLIATQCSEWDKRVLTNETNRNNLKQHETNEWKKYRSYSLVTNAGWGGGGGKH